MLATETNVKRAELLAQALPEAKRLAVLAQSAQNREALELAKGMAAARHVELAIFAADSAQDYDRAFGQISPRMALALAMALQELATNAVKYGALSNAAGQIRVHWEP